MAAIEPAVLLQHSGGGALEVLFGLGEQVLDGSRRQVLGANLEPPGYLDELLLLIPVHFHFGSA